MPLSGTTSIGFRNIKESRKIFGFEGRRLVDGRLIAYKRAWQPSAESFDLTKFVQHGL